MKSTGQISALLFISSCFIIGCSPTIIPIPIDSRINIKVYQTAIEYAENTPLECYTKIRIEKSDFVNFENIFTRDKDELISGTLDIWTVEYNGNLYLNLFTNATYGYSGAFAKVDLEGRVLAFVIDNDTSTEIRNCSIGPSTNGTNMSAVDVMSKWGRNWKDAKGNKVKILTANSRSIYPQFNHISGTVYSKLLTKDNFNMQLNTNFSIAEIKEFLYEDVIRIIEESNTANPL